MLFGNDSVLEARARMLAPADFCGIESVSYFEESFFNHLNCGSMKATGKYCWKKK